MSASDDVAAGVVPRPAPPGFRIDPFADVRMGKSLFQMRPEDWLVPDDPTTSPARRIPNNREDE